MDAPRVAGMLLGLAMIVAAAFVLHPLAGAGVLAFGGVLVIAACSIAQPPREAGNDGRA